MKTTTRSLILLSLAAAVLGLASCETSQARKDEMPRMNHAGMRMT